MAVNAIQNNSRDSCKFSYTNAIIFGSLSGYALKWALPINSNEKEGRYKPAINEINSAAKLAKRNEIIAINNENPKLPGAQELMDLLKNKKGLSVGLRNASVDVKNLLKRIRDKAIEVRIIERQKWVAYTKQIRPAGAFMFIGASVGVIITSILNSVMNTGKKHTNNN